MNDRTHHRTPRLLTLGVAALAMTVAAACDKKEDENAAAQQNALAGGAPANSAAPQGSPTPPPPPDPHAGTPPVPSAPNPHAGDSAANPNDGAQGAISDEELDQFAQAFLKVQALQAKIEKDLATAQSPEDAKQLQEQASSEASSIVQKAGLSMTQYTQIAQRLQGDEALRARLESRVQAHAQ
jgi:hypothetical protein